MHLFPIWSQKIAPLTLRKPLLYLVFSLVVGYFLSNPVQAESQTASPQNNAMPSQQKLEEQHLNGEISAASIAPTGQKSDSKLIQGKETQTITFPSIVSDKSEAVLYIKHIPTFSKNWEKNPLAKMWKNKKIRKRFSSTLRKLEQPRWELYSQRMFGQPSEKIIKLFTGQLIIINPQANQFQNLSLIAEIGNNQKAFNDMLSQQMQYQTKQLGEGEQYLQEDEEFLTSTIHSRYLINEEKKEEHFSWTISNNLLLLSRSKKQLETIIVNLQEDNVSESWSETASFQNVMAAQTDPDWIAYLSTSPLMELAQEKIKEFNAMMEGEDEEEFRQYMEMVQQAGLESIYLSAKSLPEENSQSKLDISIFYQDSSWIMSLFRHENSPLVWPDFQQKDALAASTSSINIGQIWKNVLNLPEKFAVFEHIIPMIQMQLQSYSQSSGVDLESAIIDGIGQQLYLANYPSVDSTSSSASSVTDEAELTESESSDVNKLVVFNLKDPQTVEMAINGIKKAFLVADLFKSKTYLETQIFYYNPNESKNVHQANNLMVYAIRDEQLFYSNSLATMESAIESYHHKKSQSAVGSIPEMQQVMENLPPDAIDVSYYQGAYFNQLLVDSLEMLQETVIESQRQYSCGNQTNPMLEKQKEEDSHLSVFEDYTKSVITTQHQADNFYRYHVHIKH